MPFYELQELLQPVLPPQPEALHISPAIGSAQGGGQGQEDHFEEVVIVPAISPRIGHIFKMLVNLFE